MCIRDRRQTDIACQHPHPDRAAACMALVARPQRAAIDIQASQLPALIACLLYTSDAADERSSVDLGGRRIIKKKKTRKL